MEVSPSFSKRTTLTKGLLLPTPSRELVEVSAVILGTVLAACVSIFLACSARTVCIADGRCFPIRTGMLSECSFVSCAVRASWVESVDTFYASDVLSSKRRGVMDMCIPGLKVQYSTIYQQPICHLERTFPASFNPRVGKAGAKTLKMAACGKWLDAVEVRSSQASPSYLGLDSVRESVEAMLRVTRFALSSPSASASTMSTFRSACEQMAVASPTDMQLDVKQGYARILTLMRAQDSNLKSVAVLIGFGCYGIVSMHLQITASGFVVHLDDASGVSETLLKHALTLVGEPPDVATSAVAWFSSVEAPCSSTPTQAQLQEFLVSAALVGVGAASALTAQLRQWTSNGTIPTVVVPAALHALRRLMCTTARPAEHALNALAAMCAASVMATRYSGRWESPLWSELRVFAAERLRAVADVAPPRALGRLAQRALYRTRVEHPPINEINWKLATGQSLGTWMPDDVASADSSCERVAGALFPEHMEAALHGGAVSSELRVRVLDLFDGLRAALIDVVLTSESATSLFRSPDAVANSVNRSRLVLTGAPRGMLGALSQQIAEPATASSSDGPTTMGLLQSAALTSSRLQLAILQRDVCEHPSLLDPEDVNAYYIHPFGCVVLSVAMLLPPFAEAAYDDLSLLANVGFVMAHELGHNAFQSDSNETAVGRLLSRYARHSYTEAMADVLAALTLMRHTNTKNYTTIALYQAQTWCAKCGSGCKPASTHPDPTTRIEILCATVASIDGFSCEWEL